LITTSSPSDTLACPLCGLIEHAEDGDPVPSLRAIGLFRCEGCGARFVHGRLIPRVVVEPHDGGRGVTWARLRFQDPKTKADEYVADLDPRFTLQIVANILQIVPLEHRAAVALAHSLLSKVIQ
jgi:hypothetical protein